MSSGKPNFLSQPIVKNVFMYRNGDPYYDARRIVVNQKRVANFDTLLREVTGGIQAPFGAVRNIYTPRGGHKVDCLESLQSGEQYVAAGRERFKRLDYLQIGSRRKKMMQNLPQQAKPLPPNRIIVSARFLKPIKEPCTIFVVSNGDVLNPAMRLLIHQRMLSQFERILELITEKMGLRVFGGVRSLYTYEGHQISDGNQLECGQLYVAVGRERFKKLPYSDLLFTKPRGTRRVNGMKAYSLPPIYRFSKQNGNSKSMSRCIDSGDSEHKAAPLSHTGSKDRLSAIVREISQARLLSVRKKSSGQSLSNNEDLESKNEDGNTEEETLQDQPAEEIPADDATKAAEENAEIAADKEEDVAEDTTEEEPSANEDEIKGNQENIGKKEEGEDKDENTEQNAEKYGAAAGSEEVEEEVKKQQQEVVANESNSEVKCEETRSSSSNSDKIQHSEEKDDEGQTSCEGEKDEQERKLEEETQDKDSEKGERSSEDQVNAEDTGNDQKETENRSGRTHSNNETEESDSGRYQREDVSKTKEAATKESEEAKKEVNGEVSGEDDEVLSGTELDNEENPGQRWREMGGL
ncbi:dcdc2 [Pungitius sinensis]